MEMVVIGKGGQEAHLYSEAEFKAQKFLGLEVKGTGARYFLFKPATAAHTWIGIQKGEINMWSAAGVKALEDERVEAYIFRSANELILWTLENSFDVEKKDDGANELRGEDDTLLSG